MSSGTPENVRIEKRRSGLRFDEADEVIHWSVNSVAEQVFLDNFSCYLPLGERFFVDSVRYFENRITNKILKEEVKYFIYQEAQHSISHQKFNQVLFSNNKLAHFSELYIQLLLTIARNLYSKRFQLSFTSAAEHFTAIISDWLLTNEEAFLRKNKPAVARMWVWHAIEETEHKSVAFDVFAEVTRNKYYAYFLRVMGMLILTISLFPAMAINMPLIYLGSRDYQFRTGKDRPVIATTGKHAAIKNQPHEQATAQVTNETSPTRQIRGSSLKYIVRLIYKVSRPYLQYYRFSFHPWQHDNSHLLNAVKAKFDFDAVVQRQEITSMETSSLTGNSY